jgi:23S rRNA pseudouridine1911/1915/1917 synthase
VADSILITAEQAGATLADVLRQHQPGQSWSQVRRLVGSGRIRIDGSLCLDPARRLKEGERVEVLTRPASNQSQAKPLVLRHVDAHLVVVEKPAGLRTVAHPAERDWPARRKALDPTLVDLVAARLGPAEKRARKLHLPRLRIVHRLDKDTSGLLVFARTVLAEAGLGRQFRAHTVVRRYLAIVPGWVRPQRIESRLVPDRGDGRRGSTKLRGVGKEAITHVDVVEKLAHHSLLSCRLETGRTHQIRIHLAELGHPVCGEKVYNRRADGSRLPECPGAPRLALHAAELGLTHPVTGEAMHWSMALPRDLSTFLEQLRGQLAPRSSDANQVDRR